MINYFYEISGDFVLVKLLLKDFVGKPCTTKLSYEFFVVDRVDIDLMVASKEVCSIGVIDVKSSVLLVFRVGDATVSLFRNGKIVVRGGVDELLARRVAEKVCGVLGGSVKRVNFFGF